MAAARRENKTDGYGEKLTVKVMGIDKEKNRVECATKDGAMIYAAVWETPTVFRWPEVGEVWSVRKDTGIWRMDQQVQSELMELESESTPLTLQELGEGDTRIQGETVHVNKIQGNEATFGKISATNITTTKIVGTDIWHPLSFGAGWKNYETSAFAKAEYRKTPDGRVQLRGLIEPALTGQNIIGTLPEGYRPTLQQGFACAGSFTPGNAFVRVDVQPTGQIYPEASFLGTTTGYYLFLDTIGFYIY